MLTIYRNLLVVAPPPGLAPYVKRYAWLRVDEAARKALFPSGDLRFPDTAIRLAFHFSERPPWIEFSRGERTEQPSCNVRGYQQRPLIFNTNAAVNVLSIEFTPFGFYGLFGIPPSDLGAKFEDARLLLKGDYLYLAETLEAETSLTNRVAVLNTYLTQKISDPDSTIRAKNIHDIIMQAPGPMGVQQLAREVGMSERSLNRFFSQCYGLSPKQFLRLLRFEKTMAFFRTHSATTLIDTALQLGYYDQAHFTHELKHFTGLTPSEIKRLPSVATISAHTA